MTVLGGGACVFVPMSVENKHLDLGFGKWCTGYHLRFLVCL